VSTVGYPSDSLASCLLLRSEINFSRWRRRFTISYVIRCGWSWLRSQPWSLTGHWKQICWEGFVCLCC